MDSKKIRRPGLVLAAGAAFIGGFALTHTFAQAQSGNSPQRQEQQRGQKGDSAQRIDRKIANMTETLKLSPAQVTRIRAILADERTQMDALRKNSNNQRPDDRAGARPQDGRGDRPDGGRGGRGGPGGRREMPPEVKAIHDKTEKQIESVLTAQQLSTYRAQKVDRAKRDSTQRQGRFNS